MREDNVDRLIDKIVNEADKLTPARIEAMAKVVASLRGHDTIQPAPNTVPEDKPNADEFTEDMPFDFSEIEGIRVEGQKNSHRKVQIIKDPSAKEKHA